MFDVAELAFDGEGPTPEKERSAWTRDVIAPHLLQYEGNTGNCSHDKVNNWRVSFRRYGRSAGWSRRRLSVVIAHLKGAGSNVDLKGAAHDLIYLEDWHNFHQEVTLKEYSAKKRGRDYSLGRRGRGKGNSTEGKRQK